MIVLSRRERAVLELTVAGLSQRAIAGRLGITRGAVSAYRIRVMDKLEIPYGERRARSESVLRKHVHTDERAKT